jgi:hypothetical protein
MKLKRNSPLLLTCKLGLIELISLLAACTHSLHLSHVSDFSPSYKGYAQGELVRARTEQFTVMGFVQDTKYVNDAYQKLAQNCPTGAVQGITTQFSTSHGFFSWTNVVEMQGLCVK